jgi:hypothetical protein
MKKMMSAACAAVMGCALPAAQAGGHYVAGVEGLQAASVPPPGTYYLGYLVHYDIDSFRAPDSSEALPGDNSGSVTALANRLVWISPHQVLGADWGMEAIVPVLHTSLDLGAIGFDESDSGVGDVYLGPLVLGWHGPRWDAVVSAGLWLDNASSDTPDSPGHGYRSTMLTLGGTLYADESRSASASALLRYEINGDTDAGFEPGSQVTLEWGVGKQLGPLQLGLVGYEQWQVSRDEGPGASGARSSRHALGAEVAWPRMDIGLTVKGALYREYRAEGGSGPEPRGSLLRLTLIKAF